MPTSQARIDAARRNGSMSKGPTSESGRRRSSASALKHGLCAKVLVPEDPRAIAARAAEVDPSTVPPPEGGMDDWAAGQVAVLTLRIERCQEMERAARERIVARAGITWDEDRRLDATLLGAKLAKRPDEISARLRETRHGCEWLMTRWSLLLQMAELQGGTWTPEQSSTAFDLLGTPAELRHPYSLGNRMDREGNVVAEMMDLIAFARKQIEDLRARRDVLIPLDEAARERAKSDLAEDTDAELRRLRRYEASLQRRLEWSLDLYQAMNEQPEPEPISEPEPSTQPAPEPMTPRVEVRGTLVAKPTPGVGLVDDPTLSRADRRLIKAENRREAKRRKLDALRN